MAWGKKEEKVQGGVVGGCAEHSMRGPKRDTMKAASKDAGAHQKRMGGDKSGCRTYIGTPPGKTR
jgi:hypothetical protein